MRRSNSEKWLIFTVTPHMMSSVSNKVFCLQLATTEAMSVAVMLQCNLMTSGVVKTSKVL